MPGTHFHCTVIHHYHHTTLVQQSRLVKLISLYTKLLYSLRAKYHLNFLEPPEPSEGDMEISSWCAPTESLEQIRSSAPIPNLPTLPTVAPAKFLLPPPSTPVLAPSIAPSRSFLDLDFFVGGPPASTGTSVGFVDASLRHLSFPIAKGWVFEVRVGGRGWGLVKLVVGGEGFKSGGGERGDVRLNPKLTTPFPLASSHLFTPYPLPLSPPLSSSRVPPQLARLSRR